MGLGVIAMKEYFTSMKVSVSNVLMSPMILTGEGVYPSVKMQPVYSTALADRTINVFLNAIRYIWCRKRNRSVNDIAH